MSLNGPAKHFTVAFLIALACYVVFYRGIEHRRVRKGPWQVTFTNAANGAPTLIIEQHKLAITNAQITFADQPAVPEQSCQRIAFAQPKSVPFELPFGKCVFMDTTFLPGTLTFQMFGHEIELLPRVLIIDHQEHPWLSDTTTTLHESR